MIIEALLVASLAAQAADVVKNPRTVEFTCQDHDQDDQHELAIYQNTPNGVAITTILLGDPIAGSDGVIRTTINVQPIAFGEYFAKVRAVVGTLKSDESLASNPFQRVPGQPGGVVVK